jgi:hypothetical protein
MGGMPGGLGAMMSNPAMMQMAQQMMSNPAMMQQAQQMMSNPAMMQAAMGAMGGGGGGMPSPEEMREAMASLQGEDMWEKEGSNKLNNKPKIHLARWYNTSCCWLWFGLLLLIHHTPDDVWLLAFLVWLCSMIMTDDRPWLCL